MKENSESKSSEDSSEAAPVSFVRCEQIVSPSWEGQLQDIECGKAAVGEFLGSPVCERCARALEEEGVPEKGELVRFDINQNEGEK